jgi:hypothetical protein
MQSQSAVHHPKVVHHAEGQSQSAVQHQAKVVHQAEEQGQSAVQHHPKRNQILRE